MLLERLIFRFLKSFFPIFIQLFHSFTPSNLDLSFFFPYIQFNNLQLNTNFFSTLVRLPLTIRHFHIERIRLSLTWKGVVFRVNGLDVVIKLGSGPQNGRNAWRALVLWLDLQVRIAGWRLSDCWMGKRWKYLDGLKVGKGNQGLGASEWLFGFIVRLIGFHFEKIDIRLEDVDVPLIRKNEKGWGFATHVSIEKILTVSGNAVKEDKKRRHLVEKFFLVEDLNVFYDVEGITRNDPVIHPVVKSASVYPGAFRVNELESARSRDETLPNRSFQGLRAAREPKKFGPAERDFEVSWNPFSPAFWFPKRRKLDRGRGGFQKFHQGEPSPAKVVFSRLLLPRRCTPILSERRARVLCFVRSSRQLLQLVVQTKFSEELTFSMDDTQFQSGLHAILRIPLYKRTMKAAGAARFLDDGIEWDIFRNRHVWILSRSGERGEEGDEISSHWQFLRSAALDIGTECVEFSSEQNLCFRRARRLEYIDLYLDVKWRRLRGANRRRLRELESQLTIKEIISFRDYADFQRMCEMQQPYLLATNKFVRSIAESVRSQLTSTRFAVGSQGKRALSYRTPNARTNSRRKSIAETLLSAANLVPSLEDIQRIRRVVSHALALQPVKWLFVTSDSVEGTAYASFDPVSSSPSVVIQFVVPLLSGSLLDSKARHRPRMKLSIVQTFIDVSLGIFAGCESVDMRLSEVNVVNQFGRPVVSRGRTDPRGPGLAHRSSDMLTLTFRNHGLYSFALPLVDMTVLDLDAYATAEDLEFIMDYFMYALPCLQRFLNERVDKTLMTALTELERTTTFRYNQSLVFLMPHILLKFRNTRACMSTTPLNVQYVQRTSGRRIPVPRAVGALMANVECLNISSISSSSLTERASASDPRKTSLADRRYAANIPSYDSGIESDLEEGTKVELTGIRVIVYTESSRAGHEIVPEGRVCVLVGFQGGWCSLSRWTGTEVKLRLPMIEVQGNSLKSLIALITRFIPVFMWISQLSSPQWDEKKRGFSKTQAIEELERVTVEGGTLVPAATDIQRRFLLHDWISYELSFDLSPCTVQCTYLRRGERFRTKETSKPYKRTLTVETSVDSFFLKQVYYNSLSCRQKLRAVNISSSFVREGRRQRLFAPWSAECDVERSSMNHYDASGRLIPAKTHFKSSTIVELGRIVVSVGRRDVSDMIAFGEFAKSTVSTNGERSRDHETEPALAYDEEVVGDQYMSGRSKNGVHDEQAMRRLDDDSCREAQRGRDDGELRMSQYERVSAELQPGVFLYLREIKSDRYLSIERGAEGPFLKLSERPLYNDVDHNPVLFRCENLQQFGTQEWLTLAVLYPSVQRSQPGKTIERKDKDVLYKKLFVSESTDNSVGDWARVNLCEEKTVVSRSTPPVTPLEKAGTNTEGQVDQKRPHHSMEVNDGRTMSLLALKRLARKAVRRHMVNNPQLKSQNQVKEEEWPRGCMYWRIIGNSRQKVALQCAFSGRFLSCNDAGQCITHVHPMWFKMKNNSSLASKDRTRQTTSKDGEDMKVSMEGATVITGLEEHHSDEAGIKLARDLCDVLRRTSYQCINTVRVHGEAMVIKYGAERLHEESVEELPLVLLHASGPEMYFVVSQNTATLAEKQRLSASVTLSLTCQDVSKSGTFCVIDKWRIQASYGFAPADKVTFMFLEGNALTVHMNDRILERALLYYSELINDPLGYRGVFPFYFINRTEGRISFFVHGEKDDNGPYLHAKPRATVPFDIPLSLSEKLRSSSEAKEHLKSEVYPVWLMTIAISGFETVEAVDFGTPGHCVLQLRPKNRNLVNVKETSVAMDVLTDSSGTIYVIIWSPLQVSNQSSRKSFDIEETHDDRDSEANEIAIRPVSSSEDEASHVDVRVAKANRRRIEPGSYSSFGLYGTKFYLAIRPSGADHGFTKPFSVTTLTPGSVTLISCSVVGMPPNSAHWESRRTASERVTSTLLSGPSDSPEESLTKRLFVGSNVRKIPARIAVAKLHPAATHKKVSVIIVGPPLVIRNDLPIDIEFVVDQGSRGTLAGKLVRLAVPGVRTLVKRLQLSKKGDTSNLCYADLAPNALQEFFHVVPDIKYSVSVRDLRGFWSEPVECVCSRTAALPSDESDTKGADGGTLSVGSVRKMRHGYIDITSGISSQGSLTVSARAKYIIRNFVRGCSLRISEVLVVRQKLKVGDHFIFVERLLPRRSAFDVSLRGFLFWSYEVLFVSVTDRSWTRVKLPAASQSEKWVKFNVSDRDSGQVYRLVAQVGDAHGAPERTTTEVKILPRLEIWNLLKGTDIEIRETSHVLLSSSDSSFQMLDRLNVPSHTAVPFHLKSSLKKNLVEWSSRSLFQWSGAIDLSCIGSFSISMRTKRPNHYVQALMKTSLLQPYRGTTITGVEIFKDRGRKILRLLPRPRYGPEFRIVNHTDAPFIAMQSSFEERGPTCFIEAHADQFFAWSDVRRRKRKIVFSTLRNWELYKATEESPNCNFYVVPADMLTGTPQDFFPRERHTFLRAHRAMKADAASFGQRFPIKLLLVGGEGPTRAIHIFCPEITAGIEGSIPSVEVPKSDTDQGMSGLDKHDIMKVVSSFSCPRVSVELRAANGEGIVSTELDNILVQLSTSAYRDVLDVMVFGMRIKNQSEKCHLRDVLVRDAGVARLNHPAAPLVSLLISSRVANTKLNPSELVYLEDFSSAIAPLKVGLESRFVDQLAKTVVRYIGEASRKPDEASLWAMPEPHRNDLMPDTYNPQDLSRSHVDDAGIKPVYIRQLSFEGAHVVLNFRQNGRFVGTVSDQTLDAALRYVLRLTPSIYAARLRLRGLSFTDRSFKAAEIPAELSAHFVREGLTQIRSVIPSLAVFARLEYLLLGKTDDNHGRRLARTKERLARVKKALLRSEAPSTEPIEKEQANRSSSENQYITLA